MSKPSKTILIILSIIVLSAAGGLIYWNANKKHFLRNEIEKALKKSTGGLYKMTYDKMSLDEVNGNLSFKNMHLQYDSSVYNSLEEKPSTLLDVKIPQLKISGIKTPKAILDNKIEGKELTIFKPEIKIINTGEGKNANKFTPQKEIYRDILGKLDYIKVDTLYFTQAKLNITRLKDTTKSSIALDDVSITLADILIDSLAYSDDTRLLFSKSMIVVSNEFNWTMPGTPYRMQVDSLYLQSDKNLVYLKGFHFKPELNEDAFVKSRPFQDDRFNFSFNEIVFRGVDMQSLLKEEILVDTVTIGKADMRIYRDLSIKRDTLNRVGKYPHQLLVKLNIPLHIHLLQIQNAFIEYKEKNPKTDQAGKVQFYNTNASIHYLTTLRDSAAIHPYMDADITTRFLNQVAFNVRWRFVLFDPNGAFEVNGKLAGMDATKVNVLTKPMGPASVEDGQIESLQFDLKGNDHKITGDVKFLYENLKINVMKKDDDGELKKKGLASFIANIIIKSKNVEKNGKVRTANVEFNRDTNRSIFHLIWNGIFQGIKQTVGIK